MHLPDCPEKKIIIIRMHSKGKTAFQRIIKLQNYTKGSGHREILAMFCFQVASWNSNLQITTKKDIITQ